MRRLRPLSEAECYSRCYGGWVRTVRIVPEGHPARVAFGRPPAVEAPRRPLEARGELRGAEVEAEAT